MRARRAARPTSPDRAAAIGLSADATVHTTSATVIGVCGGRKRKVFDQLSAST